MCVYLYGGEWGHSMRYSECVCIYMVKGEEWGHSMRYSKCVCIYMVGVDGGVTV